MLDDTPSQHAPHIPVPLTPSQQIADLIRTTALAHGTTYDEVLGHCRYRRIAHARRACIAAVHLKWPDYSYPRLGRIFNRDHTTIMHALEMAGVYVAGYRIERGRQMKAAQSVARFLRRFGRERQRFEARLAP